MNQKKNNIKVLYIGNYTPWLYTNFAYYKNHNVDFKVVPIQGKNILDKYPMEAFPLLSIADIIKNQFLISALNYFSCIGSFVIGLRKLLLKEKFDLIHILEPFPWYAKTAVDTAKQLNTPVIIETWENIPYNWEIFAYIGTPFAPIKAERPIHKRNKRFCLSQCNCILAKSKSVYEALLLEGWQKNKINMIYYGVDSKIFHTFDPKKKESARHNLLKDLNITTTNNFLILSVGRIEYDKGFTDILWAVKALIEKYKNNTNIYWIILGQGSLKKKLQSLSPELGLRDNIKFPGFLDYRNLSYYYNAADIFVLTPNPLFHWLEQYGFVYIEAQMCGLPVISSCTGEIPNIVKHGETGFLVHPRDPYALYENMDKLICDKNLVKYLGDKAAETSKKFDAEKKALEHVSLYKKVISGTRSGSDT